MHWHLLTPIRINGNIQYGFNIEYDRTFLSERILLKLKLFVPIVVNVLFIEDGVVKTETKAC